MQILIIPDIHGRDFWKESCQHIDEFDKVICLGDYHDPYLYQVGKDKSRHMLRDEFIPFVEQHKDKFICLLGNHDCNYLVEPNYADRFDYHHKDEIKSLLDKLDLQLVYEIDGYLFSHSGVLPGWISESVDVEGNETPENILNTLKKMSFSDPSLKEISSYRGGYSKYGSCIWGDVRAYADAYQYKEWYQIFGHTQMYKEIITDTFACLDCRQTFVLDTEAKTIKPFGNKQNFDI